MASRFAFSALWLATSSLIAANNIPLQQLANAVMADNGAGGGIKACQTALAQVSYCVTALPTFTAASELELADCLCCDSGNYLSADYQSCASYISDEAPGSTDVYTAQTLVASLCGVAGNVCSGSSPATATATATATDTATGDSESTASTDDSSTAVSETGAAITNNAAACSSVYSIIESCSSQDSSFTALPAQSQAQCICYTGRGSQTFTTAFDNYASSCAAFYSSVDPEFYSTLTVLETFCEAVGTATGLGGGDATVTDNGLPLPTLTPTRGFGGGGGSGGGSGDEGTKTILVTPTPTNAAGSGFAGQGRLVWAAQCLAVMCTVFFVL